ncbi:M48 family metallopeptidase [Roseibium sp.]|uniref:M48 family metallopeptidase n=1 Tax=Roseibium sp. TaxID=1936156 RepID=UPI00329905B2
MSELRQYDQRATAIGYRLATAARPYCARTSPTLGLTLDALERYEFADRPLAGQELGLTRELQIVGVTAGGPGDIAGLEVGDELNSIAGRPLALAPSGSPSHARVEEAYAAIERAGPESIELGIRRGSTERILHVAPAIGCDIHLVISTRTSLSTFTDGHDIDVPVGLFRFAASDDEVAFAVAHEIAHAIFNQHRKAPKSFKAKRHMELRADALAVGLMAQAGFDPSGAVEFWTRFKARDTFGFLRFPDHPSTKYRLNQVRSNVTKLHAGSAPSELIAEVMQAELGFSF